MVRTLTSLILVATMFGASLAQAHVLGPELKKGRVEIGLGHIWFHREMTLSESKEFEWEDNTLFIRYGVLPWLTVFGEGAYWDRSDNDRFPDRDYTTYRVGAGVTCRLAEIDEWRLTGSFYYGRSFWFDRSSIRYHKEVTSSVITVSINRTFDLHGQPVTLWGGPALMMDKYVEFPWGNYAETRWNSEHDLGAMLGFHLRTLHYLVISSHVAYSGYLQPRVWVGYGP